MVRELSKHQGAFLFDCCVFIARFASSSCYSSAKTRIRPVKSYQKIYMSGDNKSVVTSASIPASTRNQLRLLIIKSEKPLLQDIYLQFNWKDGKIQPYRHPQQTLGICKYLATLETSTFLEGDTNELTAKIKGSCRILGLTTLNSLLQYVNWLVWEVCSVN